MDDASRTALRSALRWIREFMDGVDSSVGAQPRLELETVIAGLERVLDARQFGAAEQAELMQYSPALHLLQALYPTGSMAVVIVLTTLVFQVVHMACSGSDSSQLTAMLGMFCDMPEQYRRALQTIQKGEM